MDTKVSLALVKEVTRCEGVIGITNVVQAGINHPVESHVRLESMPSCHGMMSCQDIIHIHVQTYALPQEIKLHQYFSSAQGLA